MMETITLWLALLSLGLGILTAILNWKERR